MNAPAAKEFLLTDQDFKFLTELVYRETGIVLAEHKRNMLYSRLTRRLRLLGLKNFRQYCDYVSTNLTEELGELVNAVTTNLTSFFREPHHFEYLRDTALPEIATRKEDRVLRIWSAGCSAGAEPYSIAMVVADFLERHRNWKAKILATDIDTNMLKRGRAGNYRTEDLKTVPQHYRKYVTQSKKAGSEYIQMKEIIRNLITFNQLNLLDTRWPMKYPFDIIFCRNVVIYFDKNTQRSLFMHYTTHMKPHSWLFIGHSESLHNVSNDFKIIGRTIYKRIPS